MKQIPFAMLFPLLLLGGAVHAQDDIAACALVRIDPYYQLKEWDCRVPNTPVRISNVYTDKLGQQRVESISSQQNAMCDDQASAPIAVTLQAMHRRAVTTTHSGGTWGQTRKATLFLTETKRGLGSAESM